MRKVLVSLAILATATAAVPAAAQYQDRGRWDQRDDRRWEDRRDRGWDDRRDDRRDDRWDRRDERAERLLLRRIDRVEDRIQRAAYRRMISPREAVSLRREANQIRHRLHRASRDGLSRREFARLQNRVERLEYRFRHERNDRDGRRR